MARLAQGLLFLGGFVVGAGIAIGASLLDAHPLIWVGGLIAGACLMETTRRL